MGFGWKELKSPTRRKPRPEGGFLQGTQLATADGWRPVETIRPGDMVLTFDHGLQPVVQTLRVTAWDTETLNPREAMPILVPVGALGNRAPLSLLPEQPVLVESDAAEVLQGDPFALVPARALDGWRGIRKSVSPPRGIKVVLRFAGDEIVYANGSALMHCPAIDGANGPRYNVLHHAEARKVVLCMMAEDTGTALGWTAPVGQGPQAACV